jgi:Kef-type K+ transport system membrane component KefB
VPAIASVAILIVLMVAVTALAWMATRPVQAKWASKLLSLVFWGIECGAQVALLIASLSLGSIALPGSGSPPYVAILWWTIFVAAVPALLFQPSKKLEWIDGELAIGRIPLDNKWDWLLLCGSATVFVGGFEIALWLRLV